MTFDPKRMTRSELYVDRAVRWIREDVPLTFASPIISQGYPDQGDALSWRLNPLNEEEKYWFRTVDAKEAHQWTGNNKTQPKEWGGLMLTKDGQLHTSWLYVVINRPMTMLAYIDMDRWHIPDLVTQVDTEHPEGGDQVSMMMPYRCFTFLEIKP